MKKSIFLKLFSYMILNIALFTLLLFIANLFFAKHYYLSNKQHLLVNTSETLNTLLKSKSIPFGEDTLYEISRLERSIGASITIANSDGALYYEQTGMMRPGRRGAMMGMSPFINFDTNSTNLDMTGKDNGNSIASNIVRFDEHSFFFQVEDSNFLIDTLRFQTRLDNGLQVLIWVPMAEINESIRVSNQLTAIIALVTMLLTGLLSFFISKQFVKPITRMNISAKKMLDLDFSQSIKLSGDDELTQLSQTINQLSSKLKSTLDDLHLKNDALIIEIDKERQLDNQRKEFISNVSHELKTPIFLIQGYAEGLKANVATNEEKRQFYTDVIIEEAEKMDYIVKDLLDLSHLESGKLRINPTVFNMSEFTYSIIQKFEPILAEKSIVPDLALAVPYNVFADSDRIEQVITNLLTNAIDHLSTEKKLHISLEPKASNTKIRFSITNSGATIPEESIDKIWTSFYKVDQARTRDLGGSGLGLSIVKSILVAHDSNYGVINIEGGVTFWFELNITDEPVSFPNQ